MYTISLYIYIYIHTHPRRLRSHSGFPLAQVLGDDAGDAGLRSHGP